MFLNKKFAGTVYHCCDSLIPYILESCPHLFYSFRGLKIQMWIIIACRLDSQSRAGFWKNDRAAVRAIRTIQYDNLLFYLVLIIIIYYSSDLPSLLITESLSVFSTQSLSSLSSTSSSHTMLSSDPSKALLMQHFLKDLTIMLSGMAFHAADTHHATSEGAACLIFPVSFVKPHTRWSLSCVSTTVECCFCQLQKLQRLYGFPSPLRTE